MAWDIHKGWPYDGAITDFAKIKTDEGLIEGMFATKNASNELIKAIGADDEKAFFIIDDQTRDDVISANCLGYIVSNAIVFTDQFKATDVYTLGDKLQVDSVVNGTIKKHTGGTAPVVATYDGTEERKDVEMIKIIIS